MMNMSSGPTCSVGMLHYIIKSPNSTVASKVLLFNSVVSKIQDVHPRCRGFCFFIRTDLEKCSFTSLANQWILCSEWVPSE